MAFKPHPWFPLALNVGGSSNSDGFELRIGSDAFPFNILFRTSRFDSGRNSLDDASSYVDTWFGAQRKLLLQFVLAVTLAFIMPMTESMFFVVIHSIGNVILAGAAVKFLYGACVRFQPGVSQVLRWHGCEHRCAWLLEKGLSPTFRTMRSAPGITPRCGSMFQFSQFQRILFLGLSCWYGSWWIALFFSSSMATTYLLMKSGVFPVSPLGGLIIRIVAFPSLALSVLVQWPTAILDPTDAQIRSAVEDFRKLAGSTTYMAEMRMPDGTMSEGMVTVTLSKEDTCFPSSNAVD